MRRHQIRLYATQEEGEEEGEAAEERDDNLEPIAEVSLASRISGSSLSKVEPSFRGSADDITNTYRRIMRDPGAREMLRLARRQSGAGTSWTARTGTVVGGPLFSPGPGTYDITEKGRRGAFRAPSYSFERSGRILDSVLHRNKHSPGPVYPRAPVDVLGKHHKEPKSELSCLRHGEGPASRWPLAHMHTEKLAGWR